MSVKDGNALDNESGSNDLHNPFVCKPLDSMDDIMEFLEDPPPWRTLCKDLTPHSKSLVRNNTVNQQRECYMEAPESFCHYSPQDDDPERREERLLPKTLVCHDMANGYHDDSIIDGTLNYDAYTFYNWAGIDIFCYFSHHLITIPPVSWINVGHAHGVKVIGTVITEWAEGIIFWDKVLASVEEYQNFASALVTIAKTLKFDGWLLNVENKISEPQLLLDFVDYLHKLMHRELPHATLVWYDSVTVQGHLNWQNGLTEKNKAFFDISDYFFTNYSWSVADIEASVRMAGKRVLDVLVGVDVWGRNFYGGGQFNTMEAVKIIESLGCSMAIFAPAWTYEALSFDSTNLDAIHHSEGLDKFQQFLLRDRALWGSIWPFLNTRVPCQLPFKTSFCRGQGKKRRQYGEVVCPATWYNLRHQHYQPNSAHGPHGYILSSLDNILKMLRYAQYTDKGGIIRYRTDFQGLRREVLSSKPSLNMLQLRGAFGALVDESEAQMAKEALANRAAIAMAEEFQEQKTNDDLIQEIKNKEVTHPIYADQNLSDKPVIADKSTSVEATSMVGTSTSPVHWTPPHSSTQHKPDGDQKKTTKRKLQTAIINLICCKSPKVDESNLNIESKSQQSHENKLEEEKNVEKNVIQMQEVLPKLDEVEEKRQLDAVEEERHLDAVDESLKQKSVKILEDEIDVEEKNRDPSHIKVEPSIRINLRHAETKSRWGLAAVKEERECLELYLEDSFIGGGCIKINPSDTMLREHRHTRLFFCDFMSEDSLVFCVVTKTLLECENQTLNIILKANSRKNEAKEIRLMGEPLKTEGSVSGENSLLSEINFVFPLDPEGASFYCLRKYLLLHEPEFYVPIDNPYGWTVRYYCVRMPGARLKSINCRTQHPVGGILLGHFGVCRRDRTKDEA